MIVKRYFPPESSFLSIEKDLGIIMDQIIGNQRLKKLLYYTSRDALTRPNLNADQTLEVLRNNIKIYPKIKVYPELMNYINISFDLFMENENNPEFRDNTIEFDIVCHHDQWLMDDFMLRPFRIAAELDTMFTDKHLTGIGTLQFVRLTDIILTDEFSGVCLIYQAIHGEEDKSPMVTPDRQEKYAEEWKGLNHLI